MIPYTEKANLEDSEGFEPRSQIPYYDKERETKIKWYDKVLLNRPSKVILALFLSAALAPALVYQFTLASTLEIAPSDGYSFGSCLLPRESRLLCGQGNITQQQCHTQCCYDLSNNLCYQRLPSSFSYILDRNWTEETDMHPRIAIEPFSFQRSIQTIRMSIDEVSRTHLTLTFYNAEEDTARNGSRLNETDYTYTVSSPELNVQVDSIRGPIFNTMRGPLVAAENIWEISFRLTNESMFGLGEIPLQDDMVKVIYGHKGGLNTIPLIFAKENGSYHGLLIDIAAPTEVSIQGGNKVVVRSVTSVELKFHLFVGPEPKDIMRDVMTFVGFENPLQYWMLGAHVCNSFSEDTPEESFDRLQQFITLAESEGMPYESHCGVRSVVFNANGDDTEDSTLRDGVAAIKAAGRRYVPHVSPYVTYNINGTIVNNTLSEFEDILLRDSGGHELYFGSANGVQVVYPDYENETSTSLIKHLWITRELADGIVLENNWPLDDSLKMLNETRIYLPYFNDHFEAAFNLTPQWNATKPNGALHLYSHNQYGNHFYWTIKNITAENQPVWTSSQWMNGAAVINKQNLDVSWANLRQELVEASLSGISGQWFWSSPVCGDTERFDNETQAILCVNWYKAATYLPLVKIHSTEVERHPLSFLGNHRAYMLKALNKRLSLLPYFYMTLQEGPLLRPMFYQFPEVEILTNITNQFSVGDDLVIVPDLLPSQSHVNFWMPPGTWYELWSGLRIVGNEGEAVSMSSTDADILTLIRGGAVLFLQNTVRLTAEEARLNTNYQLVVALNNPHNQSSEATPDLQARGSLFLTKDLILLVTADSNELTITYDGGAFESICGEAQKISASVIDEIKVYGLPDEFNNYDHHREVRAAIDLCALESEGEIVFDFIDL